CNARAALRGRSDFACSSETPACDSLKCAHLHLDTAPYQRLSIRHRITLASCGCATSSALLAVMAQPFEVDDGHPTIFQPKQPLLLKPFQALVGFLARQAR